MWSPADLDTPANRKAARSCPAAPRSRWADLTDREPGRAAGRRSGSRGDHPPRRDHPPPIYRNPKLARRDQRRCDRHPGAHRRSATDSPRFVQASSNAVFGARNPHRFTAPLRADEPMRPCDLYSAHKIEAEEIVRASSLEWVVLRFGGVLSVDLSAMPFNTDAMYFESACPATITCTAWTSATSHGRSPRLPPPTSSARSF